MVLKDGVGSGMKPRRLRNYAVDPRWMLWLMRAGQGGEGTIKAWEGDLPAGVDLVDVHWDCRRRLFLMTLEHPDFDLVKLGDAIPEHECVMTARLIARDGKWFDPAGKAEPISFADAGIVDPAPYALPGAASGD